jgi:hypothetical protein
MKYLGSLLVLVILSLALVACDKVDSSAVDLDATIQAAVEATLAAQPADTPVPDLNATIQSAVHATIEAQPTSTPQPALSAATERERAYRSYPAPTGLPGFRVYYQKRCYPGCHTYGTPAPDAANP